MSCFYRLSSCDLTDECCKTVALALQTPNSPLRELDMSGNDLHDSGVKLLSDGLKSPNCQLEILRFDIHSIFIQHPPQYYIYFLIQHPPQYYIYFLIQHPPQYYCQDTAERDFF